MTDNNDEFMNASAEEWSKPEEIMDAADEVVKKADEVVDASFTEVQETAEEAQQTADEFMSASAEEWSKPEEVISAETLPETPSDRWGAPQSSQSDQDPGRWGPEKLEPEIEPKIIDTEPFKSEKKKGFPWWGILIIVVVVLCLCLVGTVILALSILLPK